MKHLKYFVLVGLQNLMNLYVVITEGLELLVPDIWLSKLVEPGGCHYQLILAWILKFI